MGKSKLVAVILALLMLVGLNQIAYADSGALWTTDSLGFAQNGNVYTNKTDVYINGSGFDPGNYFVNVYQTSGGVLIGSTNAASFTIGSSGDFSLVNLYDLVYSASSSFTVNGFDDSANNEYKVELVNETGKKKSDNFKILQQPTPTPTPASTEIPVETQTPTATPTPVPTATPTPVPTVTPTPVPTATPTSVTTATPTPAPTPTPTPAPLATPTPVSTATPTLTPSATPTAIPTQASTATPDVTEIPAMSPPAGVPTVTPGTTASSILMTVRVPASLPNTGGIPMTSFLGFGLMVTTVGAVIAFFPKKK